MKLYTPLEIAQIQQDIPHLTQISAWIENFLGGHHPDLGRSGPVCPYVPNALKSNGIKIAVIRPKNLDESQLEAILTKYRDIFLETASKAKEPINQAFVLIFPDMELTEAVDFITSLQRRFKHLFVGSGLMFGELHQLKDTPGLHNPNFHPLRSPIPLLAIRFMVESDLIFLQSPSPHSHHKYLEAYLDRLAHQV
jgi:hypothetical protein